MEGEEKIADGIYITKAKNTNKDNNTAKTDSIRKNYVFKTTSELISLLENDFGLIEDEIKLLFEANEEMLQFDPKDYDLIQAREENLEIINKRLITLKQIQLELVSVAPIHPLAKIDIFDYFLPKNNKQNQENVQITSNNDITNNTNHEVVTEIEL